MQRSGGCSRITEEREVSWSRQHPSRTGPSRRRGCNHRSHINLQQDSADRRMANPMDPVLSHHTSQERQPAAVPELPNNKPHQPPPRKERARESTPAASLEDGYEGWRLWLGGGVSKGGVVSGGVKRSDPVLCYCRWGNQCFPISISRGIHNALYPCSQPLPTPTPPSNAQILSAPSAHCADAMCFHPSSSTLFLTPDHGLSSRKDISGKWSIC